MKQRGSAVRLTILIGDNDTWRHKNLSHEIVRRAHAAGLDGASVFRGHEGFGATQVIHTTSNPSFIDDLPMVIVIIDDEDKIRTFLPQIEEVLQGGTVTLEPCELIRYKLGTNQTTVG